jgi:hypothetical protein
MPSFAGAAASALSNVLSSSAAEKSLTDPGQDTFYTILHELGRFRFGRGEGEPKYEVGDTFSSVSSVVVLVLFASPACPMADDDRPLCRSVLFAQKFTSPPPPY